MVQSCPILRDPRADRGASGKRQRRGRGRGKKEKPVFLPPASPRPLPPPSLSARPSCPPAPRSHYCTVWNSYLCIVLGDETLHSFRACLRVKVRQVPVIVSKRDAAIPGKEETSPDLTHNKAGFSPENWSLDLLNSGKFLRNQYISEKPNSFTPCPPFNVRCFGADSFVPRPRISSGYWSRKRERFGNLASIDDRRIKSHGPWVLPSWHSNKVWPLLWSASQSVTSVTDRTVRWFYYRAGRRFRSRTRKATPRSTSPRRTRTPGSWRSCRNAGTRSPRRWTKRNVSTHAWSVNEATFGNQAPTRTLGMDGCLGPCVLYRRKEEIGAFIVLNCSMLEVFRWTPQETELPHGRYFLGRMAKLLTMEGIKNESEIDVIWNIIRTVPACALLTT